VGSAEVEIMGSKSVQELALDSENLPLNKYIYDEGGAGFRDALPFSESDLHVPVIDIGKLTSPSTAQQELNKLQSALHSCGFFMVSFSLFIYTCCLHFSNKYFCFSYVCIPQQSNIQASL